MLTSLFMMLTACARSASSTGTGVHRNTNQLVLDYGSKSHPYDAYSSVPDTRQLQADGAASSSVFDPSQRYPVKKPSTSPTMAPSQIPSTVAPTFMAYDSSLYEPLRMWETHNIFICVISYYCWFMYNLVQTIRLHLLSNAFYIIPIYLQTSRYTASAIHNYGRPVQLTIHNLPHRSSNESCYILVAASLNDSGRNLDRNNEATMSIGIRHRR